MPFYTFTLPGGSNPGAGQVQEELQSQFGGVNILSVTTDQGALTTTAETDIVLTAPQQATAQAFITSHAWLDEAAWNAQELEAWIVGIETNQIDPINTTAAVRVFLKKMVRWIADNLDLGS